MDLDKTININKKGKSYYFKCFKIELDNISNFINNLEDEQLYLVNAVISINCLYIDPYINLSRQFLDIFCLF
jgi:hypothetical protein